MLYLTFLTDALKALVLFLVYRFGRKQAEESVDAYVNKKALDDTNKMLEKREEIRGRYDRVRSSLPDTWDGVRKAGKN